MGYLDRLQPLGLLVLRLALGIIMVAHGWQKIADHMHGITAAMHQIGVAPWMAYLVVAAEFGGGILVIVGFLTRLAALVIFVDMLVAVLKVHLHHGLFSSNGGFEFPLICCAAALLLVWSGAGPIAMDALWGGRRR